MASSGDMEEGSQHPISQEKKKKTRGITKMKHVTRARKLGIKFPIGWNSKGQPIDPNKSKFMHFVGHVTRKTVPIRYFEWRDVPTKFKDRIWNQVEQSFEVQQDHKDFVLSAAGQKARAFRARLRKEIKEMVKQGTLSLQPPEKYRRLASVTNHWEEFVRQSSTKEFKKESEAAAQRAKEMTNRYRGSQKGYAQLEQDLIALSGSKVTSIPRHVLWKSARVNKKGDIVDEGVKKVVDECEILSQLVPQEESQAIRKDDILAMALGGREHPGYVRAAGFGATQRSVFGPSQSTPHPSCSEWEWQYMKQWLVYLTQMMAQLTGRQGMSPSMRGQPSQPSFNPMSSQPPFNPLSGQAPFMPGQPPFMSTPQMPVPGQSHPQSQSDSQGGSCTPIGCMEIPEVTPSSKRKHKGKGESMTSSVKKGTDSASDFTEFAGAHGVACFDIMKLYVRVDQPVQVADIPMSIDHWGKAFTDKVSKENITEIISHQWLSASTLCLYIRYLCEAYLHDTDKTSRFSFISPFELDENLNPTPHQHIVEMLMRHAGEDHLLMAPYNFGQHWVLIAINTSNETLYYMDPLRQKLVKRAYMQNLFNNAIIAYRAERGVLGRTKMYQIKWVTVHCPKQTNSVDCGYYVGLFIRDILQHGRTMIPTKYFTEFQLSTFPDTRIEQLQREWCTYLYHKFMKDKLS